MKALLIGGTGTISRAVAQRLARDAQWEVWALNRGSRSDLLPEGVRLLRADVRDEAALAQALQGLSFDVACQFIGYRPEEAERDYRLFRGRVGQYIYVSSASAYHKPAASWRVTEGVSLANPYWAYSRGKIACEECLMRHYREDGFPVTIVRPSHTYDERKIPLGVHGSKGSWQVIERMRQGRPVIIQGDGSSLWTLTHSRDFAVGFTGLMANRQAIGEAVQITGDETLTWDQIYATIADALGKPLNACHVASEFLAAAGEAYGYDFAGSLLGDKAVSVVFDNAKLRRMVPQMQTTIPFHKGVRLALDYILAHPDECQLPDPDFDAWCDRVIAAQQAARAMV